MDYLGHVSYWISGLQASSREGVGGLYAGYWNFGPNLKRKCETPWKKSQRLGYNWR